MMIRRVLLSACLCLPVIAQAHPHVFVDTSLRILTDDRGRATGVEVRWRYDDLYSLLVLEDMGLDGDYDGQLTDAETARLHGFDMQWTEGFEGDLYASGPGGGLALGPPQPVETRFEDGRIETRHVRLFTMPQTALVLKAYDPTFYTAYDLRGGVVAPSRCAVSVGAADLDAAYALTAAMIKDGDYAEDDYPAVGEVFADTVTVTCGGS